MERTADDGHPSCNNGRNRYAEARSLTVAPDISGQFPPLSVFVRGRPSSRWASARRSGSGSWGTIRGSILFTGTASPSPRGRRSTAAAAPQQFWPDQLWSSAPSTAQSFISSLTRRTVPRWRKCGWAMASCSVRTGRMRSRNSRAIFGHPARFRISSARTP
jgi:hypothetical protein